MISPLQKKLTALVLCVALLLMPRHAKGQSGGFGPTTGQAVGILVAMVAVATAIGVGIYFIARRPPSVTGCTASNGESLTLLNESDQQTYALSGNISSIKSGDRIHVSGKKSKDASGKHSFVVNKVAKDYGACPAAAAAPTMAQSSTSP